MTRNMDIDEAIAHEREVAENNRNEIKCYPNEELEGCIECAEEHEQLAEWLEELKAFQENKWTDIYIKRGYNKASDDFAEMARKIKYQDNALTDIDLDYIVEQLKAGGENDD